MIDEQKHWLYSHRLVVSLQHQTGTDRTSWHSGHRISLPRQRRVTSLVTQRQTVHTNASKLKLQSRQPSWNIQSRLVYLRHILYTIYKCVMKIVANCNRPIFSQFGSIVRPRLPVVKVMTDWREFCRYVQKPTTASGTTIAVTTTTKASTTTTSISTTTTTASVDACSAGSSVSTSTSRAEPQSTKGTAACPSTADSRDVSATATSPPGTLQRSSTYTSLVADDDDRPYTLPDASSADCCATALWTESSAVAEIEVSIVSLKTLLPLNNYVCKFLQYSIATVLFHFWDIRRRIIACPVLEMITRGHSRSVASFQQNLGGRPLPSHLLPLEVDPLNPARWSGGAL